MAVTDTLDAPAIWTQEQWLDMWQHGLSWVWLEFPQM